MKITKKMVKEAVKKSIREAINRNLDFRQLHDPDGKQGTIGTMDTAQGFGPQDEMENVLDLLYTLEHKYAEANQIKLAVALEKAQKAIRVGELELADKILVPIFEEGGEHRAVYHAIAYVRDKLGI